MSVKKGFLLILSMAIITIFILSTGCAEHQWRMEDRYPLSKNDFLLFERQEIGVETFRISKSGYAETALFGGNKIYYKSGTLSEEDMAELSEFIEESGFFRLRGTYRSFLHLDSVEYFAMSIRGEDEIKTVYVYNPTTPDEFYDVWQYLTKEVEPKLQDEIRYGTYIMARMEDYLRYENVISEEDLKAHPYLEQAINNLGWFVYVGFLDDSELDDYIVSGNDFFEVTFEEKHYFIRIYEKIE
jgi:hypothetical protein